MTRAIFHSHAETYDFLYIASHDLNEPVRGLNIYLSFFETDFGGQLTDDTAGHFRQLKELAADLTEKASQIDQQYREITRSKDSNHFQQIFRPNVEAFLSVVSKESQILATQAKNQLAVLEELCVSQLPEDSVEIFSQLKFVSSDLIGKLAALNRFFQLITSEKDADEHIDLKALVHRQTREFHRQNRFGDFEIQVRDKLPVLTGARNHIDLIFHEIIANGLEFNDQTSKLIEIIGDQRSVDILFSIRDNGIGIPENRQKEVFRLFRSAQSSRLKSGRGIGLTLAKKTVELNGGEMWLESAEERGTTVFFTFPNRSLLR